MPPESEDNDSMAEYGEGEAGKCCYFDPLSKFFFLFNVVIFYVVKVCTCALNTIGINKFIGFKRVESFELKQLRVWFT